MEFNLQREKSGLPTISRRAFVRYMAMGSAGLSIPFVTSCSGSGTSSNPYIDQSGTGGPIAGTTEVGTSGFGASGVSGAAGVSGASGASGVSGAGGVSGGSGGTGGPSIFDGSVAQGDGGPGTGGNPATDSGPAKDAVVGPPDVPVSTCPDCAKVAISRDADVVKSVRTAIDLAGGLGMIAQGDTVVIKPNITGYSPGFVTHPIVIQGIIEALLARTSKENITVAECTALGQNTLTNATRCGIMDVVEQMGVNFLAFDSEPRVPFRDNKWTHITDEKMVPEVLRNGTFKHFINAPILKNHEMVPGANAEYTCCFKNFVGLLPYMGAGSRNSVTIHTRDLGEKAAELGCIVPTITMNVVDATTPGVAGGPTPTIQADAGGLIIASIDRVACDTLAVAVLKHYAKENNVLTKPYVNKSVFAQAQVVHAAELGLGTADPAKIEILESGVDNIAAIRAEWV